MRRLLFLSLLFFVLSSCFSQQPAHYIWGEEELEDVDVYGMLQDGKGKYWFATNQGAFQFDGREMSPITLENTKSASVFNLVENAKGEIFCNNFSGQIFKASDSSFTLYYELPDSLISPYINIKIDDQDNLVVSSRYLFKLLPNKQIEIIYQFNGTQFQDLLPRRNGALCFHPRKEEYYMEWRKGELKKVEIEGDFSKNKIRMTSLFLEIEDNLYCYDTNELFLIEKNHLIPTGLVKDKNELANFKAVGDEIWLSKSTKGIRVLNVHDSTLRSNIMFGSEFVSSFLLDDAGNTLLGTFGSGIIFIPSTPVTDIDFPNNEKINDITLGSNHEIYLGTVAGDVYVLNPSNELKKILSNSKKSIECLEWIPSQNVLCIGELGIKMLNPISGELKYCYNSSLKDVCIVDDEQFLVATNIGVIVLKKENGVWKPYNKLRLKDSSHIDLTLLNHRTYAVEFDAVNNIVYAATNNGLNILNAKSELKEVKLNGNTISSSYLHFREGKLYANKQKTGLIVLENGEIISNWTKMGFVSQIESNQSNLIVSTHKGLMVYTDKGELLKSFNVSDGLYSSKINDFVVDGNEIFLVHRKGIQHIDLNSSPILKFRPQIEIARFLVNGISRNLGKQNFSFYENRFQFVLDSKSIRNKDEITYRYLLQGIDKTWQVTTFLENTIEYKSLPPGNYVFKTQSLFRNEKSDFLEVSFRIEYPYYQRTWFYLALWLFGIGIVALVFKYKLKRQKKKALHQNELNISKLTAIQSQMNPHFIFNALNSIQDLVLKGDVDNSYTYITKFANLVRRTLNYSDKDFIEFESEIKLIELYLTLEKLRFKKEFNYEIITNGIDDLLVPPMLVQPFIENALVHGLFHKKGNKNIKIEFTLEDELICTITDNGVGRAKAMEIKQRQRSEHDSFSINAIKRRFEILENHFGGTLGFEYEDLIQNGFATGTKVILRIPVKRVL